MKFIILALLLIEQCFAIDFRDAYKGKIKLDVKNVPIEYKILIDSINHYTLSKEDKNDLLSSVVISDTYFSQIPKKELFILTKMEIYKTILSFYKSSEYKSLRVDQRVINDLTKKATQLKDEIHPFSHWILNAVIRDLSKIIKYKYYQTYLTQKAQNKKLRNIELLKLDKKITLLTPWIRTFLRSNAEEINLSLRPLHFRLVNKLAFLSKTIFQTTSFESSPKVNDLNSLVLFKYSRELTTRESTLKKIDDVIGNIELFPTKSETETKVSELPKPSNDWFPQDDMEPLKVRKSDLFPKPDPNYKKPESLPEPVNDWLLDI